MRYSLVNYCDCCCLSLTSCLSRGFLPKDLLYQIITDMEEKTEEEDGDVSDCCTAVNVLCSPSIYSYLWLMHQTQFLKESFSLQVYGVNKFYVQYHFNRSHPNKISSSQPIFLRSPLSTLKLDTFSLGYKMLTTHIPSAWAQFLASDPDSSFL